MGGSGRDDLRRDSAGCGALIRRPTLPLCPKHAAQPGIKDDVPRNSAGGAGVGRDRVRRYFAPACSTGTTGSSTALGVVPPRFSVTVAFR
ncbi:hypothetical protein GCM10009102_30940 [Sphingomonas insulae]|uniref:Uncharacterized protein n=1 Tax=Sphingomonas insulae TaxID=424800 RepID=A0ABP3T901_9SPHN